MRIHRQKERSRCLKFVFCRERGDQDHEKDPSPPPHLPGAKRALCQACQDQAESNTWASSISPWGGPVFLQGPGCQLLHPDSGARFAPVTFPGCPWPLLPAFGSHCHRLPPEDLRQIEPRLKEHFLRVEVTERETEVVGPVVATAFCPELGSTVWWGQGRERTLVRKGTGNRWHFPRSRRRAFGPGT